MQVRKACDGREKCTERKSLGDQQVLHRYTIFFQIKPSSLKCSDFTPVLHSSRLPVTHTLLHHERRRVLLVKSGVVVGQLLDADHTGAAVLGAADLLLHEDGRDLLGNLGRLLLQELVDGLLPVGGRLAEAGNPGLEGAVAGLSLVLRHFDLKKLRVFGH